MSWCGVGWRTHVVSHSRGASQVSSTGLYCRSCCSVPTSALLQAQYLVIPIGMARTYLDFLGFQTPCLAIFAICDCDAFYLCAQDRVVCRTFLSASRFYRSAIVKCYVEDFREAEVRRIASLSRSLCLSQRCLAMRLVCAPDGVVCRTFMFSSLCLLFEDCSLVYRDLNLEVLCLSRWS